jgi:hypothetical protein
MTDFLQLCDSLLVLHHEVHACTWQPSRPDALP